jgi:hypothetical protein
METLTMRKRIIPALLIAVFWTTPGCQSGSREFNWQTFRYEQVGPRVVYRPAAEKPRTLEDLGEFPASARKPAPVTSAEQDLAYLKTQTFRLYIGSELPKQSEAGENFCLARKAPVDKLADVLSLLYPAQGPGGSETFRYLLYRNEDVLSQAKNMAERLDAAPIVLDADHSPTVDQSSWELALGFLYGSDYPRKLDPALRSRVVLLLNQVIENPAADRQLRWAAAILAGNLQARFEPKDYVVAGATFSRAADFTPGPSYQAMVARFHAVRLLLARNQQLTAKNQAMNAVDYFRDWQYTECYEYLRNVAATNK